METVYENGLVQVRILTAKEAQQYKNMPVGLSQSADCIRSVAVNGNKKQILEITADGFSRTNITMNDKEDI